MTAFPGVTFAAPSPVRFLTKVVPHLFAAVDDLVSGARPAETGEEWRTETYSALVRLLAGASLDLDLDRSQALDQVTLIDPRTGFTFEVSLYPPTARPVVVVTLAGIRE